MLFFVLVIYLLASTILSSSKIEQNSCLKSSKTRKLSSLIKTCFKNIDKCQKGIVINSFATNHRTTQSTLMYKLNKKISLDKLTFIKKTYDIINNMRYFGWY